jgi:putative redox protein
MTAKETIAKGTETGASAFALALDVSGHQMLADEPVAEGGADLGPNPYDLLTAALAACTAMTVRWYARREGWPLERVEVEIRHRKGGPGASSPRQDVFEKFVTLVAPELGEAQRARLIEVAAKCPVQRSLEGTPLILTRCED